MKITTSLNKIYSKSPNKELHDKVIGKKCIGTKIRDKIRNILKEVQARDFVRIYHVIVIGFYLMYYSWFSYLYFVGHMSLNGNI